ncbi:MAG: hypothetical protein QOI58_2257, partial [Thermoanaerobaculia bacterium]|nr:hypothetical protein [Thermoanaerobaculia bacterium]
SGRVLQKIGMRKEGTLRQHVIKWGEPLDVDFYGMVRNDWQPYSYRNASIGFSSDARAAG